MNSPKWTLGLACLALLLFAIAAQAGEISMDVRGLAVGTQPANSEDAPAQASQLAPNDTSDEAAVTSHRRWRATSRSTTDSVLADDAGIAADATSSGTATSTSSAPVKPRNRWQSLVPGAIK